MSTEPGELVLLGIPRDPLGTYDRLDRKVPRQVPWISIFKAIPGLYARFRAIPDSYWSEHGAGREIACPCGEKPVLAVGHGVTCACERSYYCTPAEVRVAGGPKTEARGS